MRTFSPETAEYIAAERKYSVLFFKLALANL